MNAIEDLFQDNLGRPITYKVEKYVADRHIDKRGFVVHKISAHIDGEEVGYIKISYIESKRWDEFMFNPFAFNAKMHGDSQYGYTNEELKRPFSEILLDLQRKYPYFSYTEKSLKRKIADLKRDMRAYHAYYVDKPIVDFISVEKPFRGNGIALRLHVYASKILREEFGMKLYFSTCLTDGPDGGKVFYGKIKKLLNPLQEESKNKYNHFLNVTREFVSV